MIKMKTKHIKRSFNPAKPHSRESFCGIFEYYKGIEFVTIIPSDTKDDYKNVKLCKTCAKAYGRKDLLK